MILSKISTDPYRPRVKRLAQGDLPAPQRHESFDSTSSKKKWFNSSHNRISPDIDTTAWMYQKPRNGPADDNNKPKLTRKGCFCIIITLIILLILGAIIGIILGLTLPSSNSVTSTTLASGGAATNAATSSLATTTLISIACSNTGHNLLAPESATPSGVWTLYSHSVIASKAAPTLVFGFQTDGTNSFYLDDVSVIDVTASGIQLLTNPSFENSTSTPPAGWMVSCEVTSCGSSGSATNILSTGTCFSGNCFESFCTAGRPSLIFLSQTLSTTSGNSLTISYRLSRTSISSAGTMGFYLDIL